MDFKPGPLSSQESAELNALKREVERLKRLTVSGRNLQIYRGPANIVIQFVPEPTGSGSGGEGGDLTTVNFTYLYDVSVTANCNSDGTISLTTTKTYRRTSITGVELSITTTTL